MMRIRLLYILISIFIAVIVSLPTQAQTQTEKVEEETEEVKVEEYEDAENFYRRGQIDEALRVLKRWLQKDKKAEIYDEDKSIKDNVSSNLYNLSKENRTKRANIYRLAAQCYILEDKPDTARMYIEKMMKIWPDYAERRANKEDLDRFTIATDTLYTLPQFQVGMRMGINYSFVNFQKQFPILLKDDKSEIERSGEINFQVGLIGEYEFAKFASVSLEPSYARLTYSYKKTYEGSGNQNLSYKESLEYIEGNVLANFKFFPRSKARLILSAGGNYGMLFSASKEIDDFGEGNQQQATNPTRTTTNFMEPTSFGLIGRIGGTYRFYGYALGASIGYVHYLNLANNPENRYVIDPQGNIFTFGYYSVPEDFSLSNVQLNFSIRYFINYKVYH